MGSAEAIAGLEIAAKYRRFQAAQFSLVLASIAGIVGVMALLLWLRNRRQLMLLWLFLARAFPMATYFQGGISGKASVPRRLCADRAGDRDQ
jgi:hypothetical protein